MAAAAKARTTIRGYMLENFLFSDDPADLDDEASFQATRIIDSMGMMELISFLEKEFSLKVEDSEMTPENLDSVNRLAAYIERKVGGGG